MSRVSRFSRMLKHLYDRSNPLIQSYIDRFRYRMGILPRVNKQGCLSYPQGAKAAVVISADLEMAWAWRYSKRSNDPKVLALQKADQTRQNLPPLLDLFDQFNVPVTWATVGHLFLESCARQMDAPIPTYRGHLTLKTSFGAMHRGTGWMEILAQTITGTLPGMPRTY